MKKDLAVVSIGGMERTPEILRRTRLSGSHWLRLERAGQSPVRSKIGPRARGLPDVVLDHWLAWCLDQRCKLVRLTDPFVLPVWSPDIEVSPHPPGIQMLTRFEVLRFVGFEKTCLYDQINADLFLRPAPLGVAVRRWAQHEVVGWIEDRNDDLRVLRRAARNWEPRSQPPFVRL